MIGSAVENRGIIIATAGTVHLVSGDKTVVSFDRRGLINVEVTEATSGKVIDKDGNTVKDAVLNSGTINAHQVYMTAKTANDIFENAVNNTGIIRATKLINENGIIKIVAEGSNVNIEGTLQSEGNIEIDSNAKVTVNAKMTADNIYIGKESSPTSILLQGDTLENITALSPNVEIYKTGPIFYIDNVEQLDNLVTIEGDGLNVTYLKTSNVTLKSDGLLDTNSAVILSAPTLTLIANQFGTNANPITIDTANLNIEKTTGDINIVQSTGIGTSILICGPPDGSFGSILYNIDTNLTLISISGNISISSGTTIQAKNITIEALSGNISSHGTMIADSGMGTITFMAASVNMGGTYIAKTCYFDPYSVDQNDDIVIDTPIVVALGDATFTTEGSITVTVSGSVTTQDLDGGSIYMTAVGDITINGPLTATGDITLTAGGGIAINSAINAGGDVRLKFGNTLTQNADIHTWTDRGNVWIYPDPDATSPVTSFRATSGATIYAAKVWVVFGINNPVPGSTTTFTISGVTVGGDLYIGADLSDLNNIILGCPDNIRITGALTADDFYIVYNKTLIQSAGIYADPKEGIVAIVSDPMGTGGDSSFTSNSGAIISTGDEVLILCDVVNRGESTGTFTLDGITIQYGGLGIGTDYGGDIFAPYNLIISGPISGGGMQIYANGAITQNADIISTTSATTKGYITINYGSNFTQNADITVSGNPDSNMVEFTPNYLNLGSASFTYEKGTISADLVDIMFSRDPLSTTIFTLAGINVNAGILYVGATSIGEGRPPLSIYITEPVTVTNVAGSGVIFISQTDINQAADITADGIGMSPGSGVVNITGTSKITTDLLTGGYQVNGDLIISGTFNTNGSNIEVTGALTINNGGTLVVAVTGITVTDSGKVYDGNTSATLTVDDLQQVGYMLVGDLENPLTLTGTPSGTFADKNAGDGKTVTVTGLSLIGTGGPYSVTTGLTADITPRPLSGTAIATSSSVYASSLNPGAVTFGNIVSSD